MSSSLDSGSASFSDVSSTFDNTASTISSAAIAGIVVASVVGLATFAIIAFCVYRLINNKKRRQLHMDIGYDEAGRTVETSAAGGSGGGATDPCLKPEMGSTGTASPAAHASALLGRQQSGVDDTAYSRPYEMQHDGSNRRLVGDWDPTRNESTSSVEPQRVRAELYGGLGAPELGEQDEGGVDRARPR